MVPTPEDVLSETVRGQYGEGTMDDKKVPAYRSEPNVPPDSNTETFVALKLQIDNWRWADVPFYLRTGKRLGKRDTEITIQFRRAPFRLFRTHLLNGSKRIGLCFTFSQTKALHCNSEQKFQES